MVEFVENARSELGQSQPHHSDLDDTLMEDLLVSMKSMQQYRKLLRPRNEDADHWSGHAGSHEGCFGKSGGAEVSNIAPMNAHRSFTFGAFCLLIKEIKDRYELRRSGIVLQRDFPRWPEYQQTSQIFELLVAFLRFQGSMLYTHHSWHFVVYNHYKMGPQIISPMTTLAITVITPRLPEEVVGALVIGFLSW